MSRHRTQRNLAEVKVGTLKGRNRIFICGQRGGATHSHVRSAARVSGFGDGVHQLTADTKVTQLDVAVPVQQDVGRLDVCEDEKTKTVS